MNIYVDFFMKKYYLIEILILAVILNFLTQNLINKTYIIPDNFEEKIQFRNPKVTLKALKETKKIAVDNQYDFARVLTINFLHNKNSLKKITLNNKRIKTVENIYKNANPENYNNLLKAFSAIYNDLEYFPVVRGKNSKYWIVYEDGFYENRNFLGSYKHEGCDIMAEYNVSGYYPIVSVTDGIVENIGWLPKGGYRVGVRGNHGGYFYYAHLSKYTNIKKGDKIKAGTLIGYMGDTGYGKEGTTKKFPVHLHFGIYIETKNYKELSINPYVILKYLEENILYGDY